jgi:3-oxoadipate enol-lactonase
MISRDSAGTRAPRYSAASLASLMCICCFLLAQERAEASPETMPPATTWLEANGVMLRYQLFGRGTNTVVLLHEMGTSLEVWDAVLPSLMPGHRILRYDLRGFGLSEKIRGEITLDDEVGDLRALLDGLGITDKVTLIGGAAGGAIALKFAAVYPQRIRGVVAISPAAYLAAQPERAAAVGSGEHTARYSGAATVDATFPPVLRAKYPDRFERYREIEYATDPGSMAATARMIFSTGVGDVLPTIRCPVIIVATSLYARPIESFKELADSIPGAKLEVLETGHLAALESPELLAPLLEKFLTQVGATR